MDTLVNALKDIGFSEEKAFDHIDRLGKISYSKVIELTLEGEDATNLTEQQVAGKVAEKMKNPEFSSKALTEVNKIWEDYFTAITNNLIPAKRDKFNADLKQIAEDFLSTQAAN